MGKCNIKVYKKQKQEASSPYSSVSVVWFAWFVDPVPFQGSLTTQKAGASLVKSVYSQISLWVGREDWKEYRLKGGIEPRLAPNL